MNELFLIAALALPVASVPRHPPTSLYTTESGSIKVARMLMMATQSSNRRVLLVETHPEWTWLMRESGYSAWRLTMAPEFKNDIEGNVLDLPVKQNSMLLTVYADWEPTAVDRAIRQIASTVQVGGFLVFDGLLCPTFPQFLAASHWHRLPVISHPAVFIYQRFTEQRHDIQRLVRGLRSIQRDKASYLTWNRVAWMHILSRRITQYDHNTFDHSSRVASMMVNFSRYIGLTNGDVEDARYAAWLHDYGKIVIPESILLKPGPLTEEEWVVMRTHADWGMRLLMRVPAFKGVAKIVADHHEHFDGTGYPNGKKGEDISMVARALAIVDTYDVIIHDRPYKRAKTQAWAFWELRRCAGTQFDPELVEKFISFLGGRDPDPEEPNPYDADPRLKASA